MTIDDNRLILDLSDPAMTLKNICERHNLSLERLKSWLELPQTGRLLQVVQYIEETRSRLFGVKLASSAMSHLDSVSANAMALAKRAETPAPQVARALEIVRKAATSILCPPRNSPVFLPRAAAPPPLGVPDRPPGACAANLISAAGQRRSLAA